MRAQKAIVAEATASVWHRSSPSPNEPANASAATGHHHAPAGESREAFFRANLRACATVARIPAAERGPVVLLGMSRAVGSLSGEAFAVSNRTNAATRADVRQLLELMDKDKNGVVSRDEFLQFMGETFDRLDINRTGQLERNEVRQMTNPNWLHLGINRPISPLPTDLGRGKRKAAP
jgi:hypothetical protein